MKIKTKLFLGFGTLMILMFMLAGIGVNRLTTIDESMTEIYNNRYMKVQLTSELRNGATELAKVLANLLLNTDPAKSNQNIEAIRADSLIVSRALNRMDSEFKGTVEQSMAADISTNGKKFLQYKDDVLQLYRSGKQTEANQLRAAVGVGYQDDFVASISAMTEYQEEAMKQALTAAEEANSRAYLYTLLLTILSLLLGIGIMFWIVLSVTRGLGMLTGIISNFGAEREHGRWMGSYRIDIRTTDEFADIAHIFNEIAEDLEETTVKERQLSDLNADQAWLESHIASISTALQETHRLEEMGEKFIGELCRVIGAQSGAIYIAEKGFESKHKDKRFLLMGTYAHTNQAEPVHEIAPGHGLVGQCAEDGKPIDLSEVPADYAKISSSFGEVTAVSLAIRAAISLNEVVAVFEVAALHRLTELELTLLNRLSEVAAVTIQRIHGQLRVEELLRISQALTDELQSQSEELLSQQDELKSSNEKLEEQTKALQVSEELLQHQQEELEQTNADLLRKTKQLEEQIFESEEMNRQIEHANDALEKQALELAFASKYKSEFLANMSHELRTPLNSLLILSQLLKDNKEGNLSGKQVEYAETIYSSGTDLLKLIDDVLDLAKVESGRMELHIEPVSIKDVADSMFKAFAPLARKKKLFFDMVIEEGTPKEMVTDTLRLQQVLKNLLSNAFKFTSKGSVTLQIGTYAEDTSMVRFTIADTGIGIPEDKQRMIFEAFQQADGTTSRNYGGTGLGLSISRQLAGLLGGCIELESVEGEGSQFTLYLPQNQEGLYYGGSLEAAASSDTGQKLPVVPLLHESLLQEASAGKPQAGETPMLSDDRNSLEEGDRVLLIVEDDVHFAQICMDTARERGFKVIAALQGDTGLKLAKEYKPDAILLDIQLPIIDGWSILVHLKNDPSTRHIPVHIVSVVDEVQQGLSMGAMAYLQKPSSKESLEQAFVQIEAFLDSGMRRLLLVGSDEDQRKSLSELIEHDDVQIISVSDGTDAWNELQKGSFDCMVIDMGPTDLAEFELLDRIKAEESLRRLPIVIYTEHKWDSKERLRLKKYAQSIIIKDVKSPERLLDETAMFLHRVEEHLPEAKRDILQKLYSKEAVFSGKKVLLVDDDIRNVFALSNLLERYDMKTSFAETGKQALERLAEKPDFDLVLMDIMMPEMDGYEAMRAIRSQPQFERLPIIALTAKAMKDDREKCVQAGASDYITKPVHADQLLSLIRVWLCK